MSFFLDTKVLGIPEVQSLLSQVDHELKQGQRGRLKEASGLVADEMRARTHSRRVAKAVSFDVKVNSLIDFEARIGPTRRGAFFAHFLEFGTSHSREFPFAEPALEATEEKVIDLVGFPPVLN
jgi:HK97 gp10 family phage protein